MIGRSRRLPTRRFYRYWFRKQRFTIWFMEYPVDWQHILNLQNIIWKSSRRCRVKAILNIPCQTNCVLTKKILLWLKWILMKNLVKRSKKQITAKESYYWKFARATFVNVLIIQKTWKKLKVCLENCIEYRISQYCKCLATLPKLQNLVNEDYFLKLTLLIVRKTESK
jgi:hypothetical protein